MPDCPEYARDAVRPGRVTTLALNAKYLENLIEPHMGAGRCSGCVDNAVQGVRRFYNFYDKYFYIVHFDLLKPAGGHIFCRADNCRAVFQLQVRQLELVPGFQTGG